MVSHLDRDFSLLSQALVSREVQIKKCLESSYHFIGIPCMQEAPSLRKAEGHELPAYAKHLSMRPGSQPSPPESNATDRGLTRKRSPVSCAVLSAPWSHCRGHVTLQNRTPCFRAPAGVAAVCWASPKTQMNCMGRCSGNGNDQHLPKEAACSEEKTPLLCTKLLRCLVSVRGIFLTFYNSCRIWKWQRCALGHAGLCFQFLVGTVAVWTCLTKLFLFHKWG